MANNNKASAPENGTDNTQELQELQNRLAEAEARAAEAEQKNAEAEARAAEAEQKNAEAEAKLAAIEKDAEKTAGKKPGTVRIKIPFEKNGPNDDQQVFINGRQYIIKRGVEVDAPRGVAEILQNREKMMHVISEFDAANAQE